MKKHSFFCGGVLSENKTKKRVYQNRKASITSFVILQSEEFVNIKCIYSDPSLRWMTI